MRLLARIADDVRRERRVRRRAKLPPGDIAPSFANTRRIISDPLGLLLEHERRFGPVFTIRLLHEPIVWAVGAEVNHQILVGDFDAFSWREGRFADLWPLLGDGMLNIDGAYHREFRMLMLPAFHRDYVAGVAATMIEEAVAAAETLATGRWSRSTTGPASSRCGSRCVACSGSTATGGREQPLAKAFEESLAIHGEPVLLQLLPLPRTPLARAIAARQRLDALVRAEIDERRRRGDPGRGVLGLLLAATDDARVAAARRRGPRPGGDAAVRGARHDHDHVHVPAARARPHRAGAPGARGGARPGARRPANPTPGRARRRRSCRCSSGR